MRIITVGLAALAALFISACDPPKEMPELAEGVFAMPDDGDGETELRGVVCTAIYNPDANVEPRSFWMGPWELNEGFSISAEGAGGDLEMGLLPLTACWRFDSARDARDFHTVQERELREAMN